MDKFIGRYILPELTHKEIDNLNSSVSIKEVNSLN